MPPRLIAIGDIHGCLPALTKILGKISPQPDDTIVTLGDYVDRGPDSRGVLDTLIELQSACHLVPLLGNHDDIFLNVCENEQELFRDWLCFGGDATLASYKTGHLSVIPDAHLDFLKNCKLLHETERHFFVHGSYNPNIPLDCQHPRILLWGKMRPDPPGPHFSGKTAIVGHTAQRNGKIFDLGYVKCIDTCCYDEGYLTAMEVNTGQVWQADKTGKMKGKS